MPLPLVTTTAICHRSNRAYLKYSLCFHSMTDQAINFNHFQLHSFLHHFTRRSQVSQSSNNAFLLPLTNFRSRNRTLAVRLHSAHGIIAAKLSLPFFPPHCNPSLMTKTRPSLVDPFCVPFRFVPNSRQADASPAGSTRIDRTPHSRKIYRRRLSRDHSRPSDVRHTLIRGRSRGSIFFRTISYIVWASHRLSEKVLKPASCVKCTSVGFTRMADARARLRVAHLALQPDTLCISLNRSQQGDSSRDKKFLSMHFGPATLSLSLFTLVSL